MDGHSHRGKQCHTFRLSIWESGQIIGTTNVSRFARQHLDDGAGLGLNVKLGYRGTGVGRSLLKAALAWFQSAPQLERLVLEVTSNNLPAIHLYRSAVERDVPKLRL